MNRDLFQIITFIVPLAFLLISNLMTAAHLIKRGRTWKNIGVYASCAAIITVALAVAWWALGSANRWFVMECSIGWNCSTQWEYFLATAWPVLPFLFLVLLQAILGIVLLRMLLSGRKSN
jgi:hypothetical protein